MGFQRQHLQKLSQYGIDVCHSGFGAASLYHFHRPFHQRLKGRSLCMAAGGLVGQKGIIKGCLPWVKQKDQDRGLRGILIGMGQVGKQHRYLPCLQQMTFTVHCNGDGAFCYIEDLTVGVKHRHIPTEPLNATGGKLKIFLLFKDCLHGIFSIVLKIICFFRLCYGL